MNLPYSWDQLAKWTHGTLLRGGQNPRRFSIDSRHIESGDAFVALRGERHDGHDFLAQVARAGAAGALVARKMEGLPPNFALLQVEDPLIALQSIASAHRQEWSGRVLGVTGSNGKTTTKEMLAHILTVAGKSVLATRGNLNSQIGLPLMLLELTPEHSHAVLEMGASQKGDIAQLARMAKPSVGIITGIGRAHLASFGNVEGVLTAKWELVESLPSQGLAVLNADDPLLMTWRKKAPCPVVTFGFGPHAEVRAENIRQDPQTVFDLVMGGARREIRLPVPGRFNVSNALAAAAVALWERIHLTDVVKGLGSYKPPPMRMQMQRRADGALFVMDAYNANPDSMAGSLESFVNAFASWPQGVVLGSMLELGEFAEAEHRALGRQLARWPLAYLFFAGPEGKWVEEGYRESEGRGKIQWSAEAESLLENIRSQIRADHVVLFKASRGVHLENLMNELLKGK